MLLDTCLGLISHICVMHDACSQFFLLMRMRGAAFYILYIVACKITHHTIKRYSPFYDVYMYMSQKCLVCGSQWEPIVPQVYSPYLCYLYISL